MPGALDVVVSSPSASAVLAAPGFTAEWSHTRVSDGASTTQNDKRVRIWGTSDLTYQTVTADATAAPGTQASDDANSGTIAWADPGNVVAQDAAYAVAENEGTTLAVTEYLKLTNFGFDLPATAEVLGIEVLARRRSTQSTPQFVGASEARIGSAGSIVINRPSGVAAGHVLLFFAVQFNDSFNVPAGFTLLDTGLTGGGANVQARLAFKVATDSEPTTYTASGFDSAAGAGMVAYSNALPPDIALPETFDVNAVQNATASAPSVTVIWNTNALHVCMFIGQNDLGAWSTPSGMTERFDDDGFMVADRSGLSVGGTGSRTSTYAGSDRVGAAAIVLQPVSTVDARVSLVLPNGTIGVANRAKTGVWSSSDEDVIWGHSADLWDEVGLTGADMNDTDTGVVIAVTLAGTAGAMLDHVQIRVTYRYADQLLVVTSPLYDSGQTASATGEHAVPSNNGIRNNQTYYLRVDVTDTDGLEGASDLVEISTSWTPPPTITGLTVTPVGGTAVVGGGS